MEKFYPKNFMLWHPQIILLLIFLEAIYDTSGSTSNPEASLKRISRGAGIYKDNCRTEEDCQKPDFYCDKTRSECHCRNHFHFDSKIDMFYDEKTQKCLSAIGKVCTLEDDGLWELKCVPYADCLPHPEKKKLPSVLGLCKCKVGFEESENHLCYPVEVIHYGDRDPIFSMAQVQSPKDGTVPVEGNMSENSQSEKTPDGTGHNGDMFYNPISTDTEDLNSKIKPRKDQLETWKDNEYASDNGGYVQRFETQIYFFCLAILLLFL